MVRAAAGAMSAPKNKGGQNLSMELAVGAIVEGKVTGITKFGAFVSLPGNKTGMVHISEIAHAYVSDINEYLTVGQDVKVKIIAMEQGKINLSIKKTMDPPPRTGRSDNRGPRNDRGDRSDRNDRGGDRGPRRRQPWRIRSAPEKRIPFQWAQRASVL